MIEKWKNQGEIRKLIKLLADPDEPHQELALQAIKEIGSPAEPALLEMLELSSNRPELRRTAAELLALLKSRLAVPRLKAIARDLVSQTDEDMPGATIVWTACVDALGRIGENDSLELLEELSLDDSVDLERRRRAVEALSLSESDHVSESMARIWWDAVDDRLRSSAISGIIAQGQVTASLLMRLYAEADLPAQRRLIIGAIGAMQAREYLNFLIDQLGADDQDELADIITALGEIGDYKAYAPLKLRFTDFNGPVRILAARALISLGWKPGDEEQKENRLYYHAASGDLEKLIGGEVEGAAILEDLIAVDPGCLLRFAMQITRAEPLRALIDTLLQSPPNSAVVEALSRVANAPALADWFKVEQANIAKRLKLPQS
jgi:HEAT repeat protein